MKKGKKMGTNYYLETDYCSCCGHARQRIHIGKSSAGWRFNFDGVELKCSDIEQIREKLKYGNIENEYGEQLSYDDFLKMVELKQQNESRGNDKYTNTVNGYEISNTSFS